ncbi:metallophosphoesterase [Rhodoplanes roseus]|uniref:metallophosphoesterase n=1 Tax=Rhodoplanes roseus TaxID=29409 RepID=UPI0026C4DE6E
MPPGYRVYAVGDVHGRDDLLRDVFIRIDSDLKGHPSRRPIEVYLGDYIDRGPGSCAVIDLLTWRAQHREVVVLKGNHETFVPAFLENPAILRDWSRWGGLETLMSYGLRPSFNPGEAELMQLSDALRDALPDSHQAFFDRLVPNFELGDFYFAHAGVRPGRLLSDQVESDLLWIREEFLTFEGAFEKVIIHGHTPVIEPEFRPNRINIDTGAYATGRLTCLMIENDTVFIV